MATMSEPRESLDISDLKDTFLECPVCVEHFNQTDRRPRLLHSCLHAFCTQCLEQLLVKEGKGQITCPLCRQVQRVKGKVDTLRLDPVRGKLVEYVQIKHKQRVICGECEENDAVSRCQECQSYLCKDCDYVHRRHRVSRDHQIISLEEVLQQPVKSLSKGHFCPSHPKHHLEFYCSTEEQLCCVSCTVLDHKGHDLQKLDEAAAARRDEVETRMEKVHQLAHHLEKARKEGTKQEKIIADTKSESLADIDKMFDSLKKALDKRKRQLVAVVNDKSTSLLSAVQKTSAAYDHTLAIIESTETYFTQAKEKADVVEMLQMYPAIIRSVESLQEPNSFLSFDKLLADFTFRNHNAREVERLTKELGSFTEMEEVQTAQIPLIQSKHKGCKFLTQESKEPSGGETGEECTICQDVMKDVKVLQKCGHKFCRKCIDHYFQKYKPMCPVCGAIYGAVIGDMPPGTMYVRSEFRPLPGYGSGTGKFIIRYDFPDGKQTEDHPNPGKWFKGTHRVAYLPDTTEGRTVLGLLKVAFDRKLTFTVGRSVTTGKEDAVTWNYIHHKTSDVHGGNFGYPDPEYLARVKVELAAKGVTQPDIDWSTKIHTFVHH